jgi:hypothetical protein
MKTFEDIKREIEERNARLMDAFEAAKARRTPVPVTKQELAALEELCTARPRRASQAAPQTAAPEWEWIRC